METENLEIQYSNPGFKFGDIAWAIMGPDYYPEIIIDAFNCVIFPDEDKLVVMPMSARIDRLLVDDYFDDDRTSISDMPFCRLARTESEGKSLTRFHKVVMTNEEWYKITGVKEDYRIEIDEECELGVCCATISHIRDLLLKCRDKGGLIEYDKKIIEVEMTACPLGKEEGIPLLTKVLKQLEIKI